MRVYLKSLVTFESSDYLASSPGQFTTGEWTAGSLILDLAISPFGPSNEQKIFTIFQNGTPNSRACRLQPTDYTELPSFTFPNYWLKLWTEIYHKFLGFLICNYIFVTCSYRHVWSKLKWMVGSRNSCICAVLLLYSDAQNPNHRAPRIELALRQYLRANL